MVLAGAQGTSLANNDFVAFLGFILFIVRHKLLSDRVLLAVQGMRQAHVFGNHNSFIGLLGRNDASDSLGHYFVSFASCSPRTVSIRARSLRLPRMVRTFWSSPIPTRRFSSIISSRSLVLWAVSSSVDSLRISTTFILELLLYQELSLHRQLVGGQAHSF